jgi:hypothetical protein
MFFSSLDGFLFPKKIQLLAVCQRLSVAGGMEIDWIRSRLAGV